jgi:hypothetical protein
MGCTQSRTVAADVTYPNFKKLDRSRSVSHEQHPESAKSSNTVGSTTSNVSTESLSCTIPPIITNAFDFEYEIPVVYEMTTEDDAAMVHAITRLEDRLVIDSPFKKHKSPRNIKDEEFLTDDFYEPVPNMDVYLNQPECSVMVVPHRRNLNWSRYVQLMKEEEKEETAAEDASSSQEDRLHRRALAIHAEQQKRLSVIHMLLPWTHAIATRKQRHIHSRQYMRSSFVGLSLLMWPQMLSSQKNRTTRIRSYNPTSLFRR